MCMSMELLSRGAHELAVMIARIGWHHVRRYGARP